MSLYTLLHQPHVDVLLVSRHHHRELAPTEVFLVSFVCLNTKNCRSESHNVISIYNLPRCAFKYDVLEANVYVLWKAMNGGINGSHCTAWFLFFQLRTSGRERGDQRASRGGPHAGTKRNRERKCMCMWRVQIFVNVDREAVKKRLIWGNTLGREVYCVWLPL